MEMIPRCVTSHLSKKIRTWTRIRAPNLQIFSLELNELRYPGSITSARLHVSLETREHYQGLVADRATDHKAFIVAFAVSKQMFEPYSGNLTRITELVERQIRDMVIQGANPGSGSNISLEKFKITVFCDKDHVKNCINNRVLERLNEFLFSRLQAILFDTLRCLK